MLYFTEHYHVSHSLVSALMIVLGAAALIGVVGGGQLAEWLLARGPLNARLVVPGVALIVAVPFLGFGIWTRSVALGIVLMAIGAGMLAAADAPIDAARLDISSIPGCGAAAKPAAWRCARLSRAVRRWCSARCRPGSAAAGAA